MGLIGDTRLPVESIFTTRARFAILGFLSCALLVPLAGCHGSPSPDVVATVNGKSIMRADLERYYKANLGDNPQQPSEDQGNIGRLTILHGMIEDEILQQRAIKLNLAATDEDVNAKLTEIKAPYTQEEFDKRLQQRDMTLDDYKRFLRRSLTNTKLLNKEIESKINITDAEIAAYYAAHKAEFNLIEPQYHLAWILTTSAPAQQTGNLQNNKASGDADAKKKIQTLHSRLEGGEDFGALAANFSEDPNTASNGGDRGFVAESQLHADFPEVYNAISNLKPGQITEVLPVYDSPSPSHHIVGYTIYELIAREPAGQRELNDPRVQQSIHTSLHDSRYQLLRSAYFEMLHDEAKVNNYFADQILKGAQ
jgi:peptidyl-prolyl cis-trans isomerase SurA